MLGLVVFVTIAMLWGLIFSGFGKYIKKDWRLYWSNKNKEYSVEINNYTWSIDINTFEVLNEKYRKDKNNVYRTHIRKNMSLEIVDWVDSESFKVLDYDSSFDYPTPKGYTYFWKIKIMYIFLGN